MFSYEIRQIDAWSDGEGGWDWNDSFIVIPAFVPSHPVKDEKRLFLRELHKIGVFCVRGACYVSDDGEVLELRNRKTHEPLYAMMVNEI